MGLGRRRRRVAVPAEEAGMIVPCARRGVGHTRGSRRSEVRLNEHDLRSYPMLLRPERSCRHVRALRSNLTRWAQEDSPWTNPSGSAGTRARPRCYWHDRAPRSRHRVLHAHRRYRAGAGGDEPLRHRGDAVCRLRRAARPGAARLDDFRGRRRSARRHPLDRQPVERRARTLRRRGPRRRAVRPRPATRWSST